MVHSFDKGFNPQPSRCSRTLVPLRHEKKIKSHKFIKCFYFVVHRIIINTDAKIFSFPISLIRLAMMTILKNLRLSFYSYHEFTNITNFIFLVIKCYCCSNYMFLHKQNNILYLKNIQKYYNSLKMLKYLTIHFCHQKYMMLMADSVLFYFLFSTKHMLFEIA